MGFRVINGEVVDSDAPKVRVSFYEHPLQVGKGRYIPCDYIKRQAVGARDFVSRRATEQDKLDYPAEWEAYQSGKETHDAGSTPLTALPAYRLHLGLELKAMRVETIEQLAFCDECPLEGAEKLWKQAKRYIELEEGDVLGTEAQATG